MPQRAGAPNKEGNTMTLIHLQHDTYGSPIWFTPARKIGVPMGWCYVAGPMTGRPGFNYPAFDAARDLLADEGWNVISPADLDRQNLGIDFSVMTGNEQLGHLSTAFARQDISSLLVADRVFLLDGWEGSTGATNEGKIATMLGVPVFQLSDREPIMFDARFSNVIPA